MSPGCPHCQMSLFAPGSSRDKLKISRTVVVLHKGGGVEVNCPHCRRGVMLGTLDTITLQKALPRLIVRPIDTA
jgi:hypothetical protein